MNDNQQLDTKADRRRRITRRIDWRPIQKPSLAETIGAVLISMALGGIGIVITVLLHNLRP